MNVRYPDLSDYLAVAAKVTGLDIKVVLASVKMDLADSALHALGASFGGEEFYPDFCEKAGVLFARLGRNRPLLDGNKRAVWVTLRLFLEMNLWTWSSYPSIDEAERVVVAVAAGETNEQQTSDWLRRDRIEPSVRHIATGAQKNHESPNVA